MSSDSSSPKPAAGEVGSQPTKSVSPKTAFGVSRIILLVLLLGAVAVLAWDYMSRSKYHTAQAAAEEIAGMAKADPAVVAEKMGEPDDTVETDNPKKRSDFYKFPTAFYVYTIEFKYRWLPPSNSWAYTGFDEQTEPRFWAASEDDEEAEE